MVPYPLVVAFAIATILPVLLIFVLQIIVQLDTTLRIHAERVRPLSLLDSGLLAAVSPRAARDGDGKRPPVRAA
jgi:hypothetical protein